MSFLEWMSPAFVLVEFVANDILIRPFDRSVRLSPSTDFDVKERVRAATDIVDVIGHDLELRPQGRHFVARCPFHNDTRPSMTVNQERQSWKCWVCDIGGDIFSFVMQREGVDFPTALRSLAERAGIEIPEFNRGPKTQPGSPDDKATLMKAVDLICRAYFDELACGKSDDAKLARDYLASRGIDDSNRELFKIGFAPDSWDFAVNLLKRNKFSEAVAQAAGVAIGRDGKSGCYDRFRGRLMFPIDNAQGQAISLGGRIIPAIANRIAEAKGDGSNGGAKYINGPETMLFRKSNELYGLHLARDAMRAADEVLVMEGYTDVVATRMAGIDHSVAVLGTALTASHVRVLKRFVNRVVLVLDGDDAGKRRAEEVLELFVTADADLRILTLPDGLDPADFLAQQSAANLLDMAGKAPDAMDHKLNRLTEGVDVTRDTHRVTTAIETMLGVLTKTPTKSDKTELKIDQLLVRMSQTFGLPVERLQRRLETVREETAERERKQARYRKANTSGGHQDSAQTSAPASQKPASRPPSSASMDDFDPFEQAAMEDAAAFGIDEGFDDYAPSTPSDFGAANHPRRNSPSGPTRPQPPEQGAAITGVDRELFEILIESPEVAAMAVEAIDPSWLHSNTAKMLLSAYQDLDLQGRDLDVDSVLVLLENDFLKNQIITLQERIEQRAGHVLDEPHLRYTAILTRFREREFDAEKTRQIEKLQSASLPEDEELAMLEQLFAAERIRQTPR
ncbi:MAG TPA: DNA primase [Rhodopirellula baltica]|uniref:DNA primase n=1 Tax=Rhodopirellula baltica (strain DSM 10527 / NCIMB 13988 / SH1) TaxID=243090 RepID=Q7UQG2_RHOBA|nr:DNA primase [Rhodopirellula baltica]CAD74741.1 DNA primase [Rhodopirellula baltica SH 1]HBE62510.1 DNA primase [Rhodopirellula baltica]